jgi:hypothetical protein
MKGLGLGGEGNKGDATVFGPVRLLRGQNVFAADLAATVSIWLSISRQMCPNTPQTVLFTV